MKRLILIIFISLPIFLIAGPKKPAGCHPYHCDDYHWDHELKRFDPHTIKWPLHYTGELKKDRIDGGREHIDVIFQGHYDKELRLSLREFRYHVECPSPEFLSVGIEMDPVFVCREYASSEPEWERAGCSLVGSSVEDRTLEVDGDGCAKKLRTWTVLDWCTYQPNKGAENSQDKYVLVKDLIDHEAYYAYDDSYGAVERDGYYSFTQVIKITDETAPYLVDCEPIEVDLSGDCEGRVTLANKVVDEGECGGKRMDVDVKIYDIDGKLVADEWFYAYHDVDFEKKLRATLSVGLYTIKWSVKDGCGNYYHCEQQLSVVDDRAPAITCIHNLSTSISDEYGMTIWAKDFVLYADDQCGAEVQISFSPDSLVMDQSFYCEDGFGFKELMVYAIDEYGNTSACPVELFIEDRYACSDTTMGAGGVIETRYGEPVEAVALSVGGVTKSNRTTLSNEMGQYYFEDIPVSTDEIELHLTAGDLSNEGLDANDLFLLSQHLFGGQRFDDVLDYAAADINNDAQITMDDYWALVSLVYGLPLQADGYRPWKYIDQKKYRSGINRASLLTTPIMLSPARHRYDILALKSGDIDFSWSSYQSKTRSHTLVDVELAIFSDHSSLDLSDWDQGLLLLNDVSEEEFRALNPYLTDDKVVLTTVKNGILVNLIDVQGLTENIRLRSVDQLDLSESVVKDGNTGELRKIRVNSQTVRDLDISIYPNPMTDRSVIELDAPAAVDGSLVLFDALGRRMISTIWPKGVQSQTIDLSATDTHGLLIAKIQFGKDHKQISLIRVK